MNIEEILKDKEERRLERNRIAKIRNRNRRANHTEKEKEQIRNNERKRSKERRAREKLKKKINESATGAGPSNRPATPTVNSSTSPRTLSVAAPPPNQDLLRLVKGIEQSYGVFR